MRIRRRGEGSHVPETCVHDLVPLLCVVLDDEEPPRRDLARGRMACEGPSVTKPSAKPLRCAGQFHGMAKPKPRTPVRRTTARPVTPVRSAKPDGDGSVKAVANRIDALIEREVPDVRRAIKWNMPFYGIEGQGWFRTRTAARLPTQVSMRRFL